MEFIYFIFLIIGALYLPGKFILRIINFESENIVIQRFLGFSVGIVFFLLSVFFLSYVKIPYLYNVFILISVVYEILHFKFKKPEIGISIPELIILLTGIVGMSYLTFKSGIINGNIMQFFSSGGVDYIYHLSLIGNLTHNFPLTQPALSGIPLRGYHFFYDFLIANFVNFYKLNIVDSLFRYFPIFLSFLYGLSGIALARFLSMKKLAASIFLFLLYFADGFQFIFNYIGLKGEYNSGINSQLVYIVDPSVLLSIVILFSAFIVIFSKKKSLLLAALLFGILPQVKIYMAVLAYAALFLISILNIYREKEFFYFKTLIIGGIISAIIYLPMNFGAGGLIFAPFLYYRHFMETSAVFDVLKWPFKYQVYDFYHNYIRLGILYVIAILLMLIPSLGLRIASVINFKNFKEKKNYSDENIFLATIIALGYLFITFFIQTVAVFNSVQFLWIAYTILLIPTAIALEKIVAGKIVKTVIVLVILIALTLPENIRVLGAFTNDLKSLDRNLVEATFQIKKYVQPKENILLLRNKDKGVPFVAALTSRSVYYESQGLEFANAAGEIEKRRNMVASLEKRLDECQNTNELNNYLVNFMNSNNLKYIFSMQNEDCLTSIGGFEEIKLNDSYQLYKIK